MNKKEVAKKFIAMLLHMQALKINVLQPYTWASGWKSPMYCNNRAILGYPHQRDIVKQMLVVLITESHRYGDNQNIVIAGVATGAISLGSLAADALHLPFVYVHSKPKDHGLGNQIEGRELNASHKVIVFEDLISTGQSSLKAVETIRATGAEVLGVVALVTYNFPIASKAFYAADVPVATLADYETIEEVLEEERLLQPDQKPILKQWRMNPANWEPAKM
ncbi:orotate phosphoribosyltransferase [Patescibacteria group bacterium]|nr:orotate phosphoribosyltransferase [Patescibacteria group bacterium]